MVSRNKVSSWTLKIGSREYIADSIEDFHLTPQGAQVMKAEIKGSELIITITLQKPTPSASGKTLVVASSHGNQPTGAVIDGKPVIVGLNAYLAR